MGAITLIIYSNKSPRRAISLELAGLRGDEGGERAGAPRGAPGVDDFAGATGGQLLPPDSARPDRRLRYRPEARSQNARRVLWVVRERAQVQGLLLGEPHHLLA